MNNNVNNYVILQSVPGMVGIILEKKYQKGIAIFNPSVGSVVAL